MRSPPPLCVGVLFSLSGLILSVMTYYIHYPSIYSVYIYRERVIERECEREREFDREREMGVIETE